MSKWRPRSALNGTLNILFQFDLNSQAWFFFLICKTFLHILLKLFPLFMPFTAFFQSSRTYLQNIFASIMWQHHLSTNQNAAFQPGVCRTYMTYTFHYLPLNHHIILFADGSAIDYANWSWKDTSLLKVILFFILFFFFCCFRGVSEAGDQTMGHAAGPAMEVVCFNPGSRLKEKSEDAAVIHWHNILRIASVLALSRVHFVWQI